MEQFLWAAVGARGSTYDIRLLQICVVYDEMEERVVLPNRLLMGLPFSGTIPFTTVREYALPQREGFK